jgi:hypothetical protein
VPPQPAPAAAVARATLEVIFDPKGAPYRSARPQTMAPGRCELPGPSSTFDSRGNPRSVRSPRKGGWGWGWGPTPDSTPSPRPPCRGDDPSPGKKERQSKPPGRKPPGTT